MEAASFQRFKELNRISSFINENQQKKSRKRALSPSNSAGLKTSNSREASSSKVSPSPNKRPKREAAQRQIITAVRKTTARKSTRSTRNTNQ
jgi:hypothetical protein